VSAAWPNIPYEPWRETCSALHIYLQIAGKYRLGRTPWVNHSWHATFYVTARASRRPSSLTVRAVLRSIATDSFGAPLVPADCGSGSDRRHRQHDQEQNARGGPMRAHGFILARRDLDRESRREIKRWRWGGSGSAKTAENCRRRSRAEKTASTAWSSSSGILGIQYCRPCRCPVWLS
jgi:hypothetical protein